MKKFSITILLLSLGLIFSACTSNVRFSSAKHGSGLPSEKNDTHSSTTATSPKASTIAQSPSFEPTQRTMHGFASYYGDEFHGHQTASGEVYDMSDMTAAHRDLPFGTKVRITNLKNKRQVIVRINDRGPVKQERMIDLSKAAAEELDMIREGIAEVEIEIL